MRALLSSFGEQSLLFSKGFPKKNAKLISQTRATPNLIEKCSSCRLRLYQTTPSRERLAGFHGPSDGSTRIERNETSCHQALVQAQAPRGFEFSWRAFQDATHN